MSVARQRVERARLRQSKSRSGSLPSLASSDTESGYYSNNYHTDFHGNSIEGLNNHSGSGHEHSYHGNHHSNNLRNGYDSDNNYMLGNHRNWAGENIYEQQVSILDQSFCSCKIYNDTYAQIGSTNASSDVHYEQVSPESTPLINYDRAMSNNFIPPRIKLDTVKRPSPQEVAIIKDKLIVRDDKPVPGLHFRYHGDGSSEPQSQYPYHENLYKVKHPKLDEKAYIQDKVLVKDENPDRLEIVDIQDPIVEDKNPDWNEITNIKDPVLNLKDPVFIEDKNPDHNEKVEIREGVMVQDQNISLKQRLFPSANQVTSRIYVRNNPTIHTQPHPKQKLNDLYKMKRTKSVPRYLNNSEGQENFIMFPEGSKVDNSKIQYLQVPKPHYTQKVHRNSPASDISKTPDVRPISQASTVPYDEVHGKQQHPLRRHWTSSPNITSLPSDLLNQQDTGRIHRQEKSVAWAEDRKSSAAFPLMPNTFRDNPLVHQKTHMKAERNQSQ